MSFNGLTTHFLLVPNNILLTGLATSQFIYSCTERHLSCFQGLVIVNEAAKIPVYKLVFGHKISTSLYKHLEAWFLDDIIKVHSVYKKPANCLLWWLYRFAFPPMMNTVSHCLSFLPAFDFISILGNDITFLGFIIFYFLT